jgi:sugar phosphate isomerase/epimerase
MSQIMIGPGKLMRVCLAEDFLAIQLNIFKRLILTMISRRNFLGSALAASLCSRTVFAERARLLRIGVTDWNLNLGAKTEAVPLAAKLGFDGIQISFGRQLADGKLPTDNPEIISRYLDLARQSQISIDGTCVDRLHDNGLKSDPLGPKWVADAIRLTLALRVKVLLLPFFGRWALQTKEEMDYVGDALRELAPEATKAGVVLGLEDTISAEDNARIMERSKSESVLVYYDVGNSSKAGFDPVKEIRWLGKDRICQFHLKDNPHFLGEGSIQFPSIIQAIHKIGFTGFANLETDSPSNDLDNDMERNLTYIRNLVAKAS